MKKYVIITMISLVISLNYDNTSAKRKKAPNFALFNMKGRLVSLSKLIRQKNIILSFWASYCVPCKKEMPQLVQIEKQYRERKNLRLIFIGIDKEGKKIAEPMLNEMGIENECLFDIYQITAKKYIPKLKIPATFLINKRGYIIFKAIGYKEETIANLEKAIKRLR